MRRGDFDEAELEAELDQRGLMTRFYARATRAVRKPWHMYPLGCLFGLGFDTATEVALLVLAGAGAAGGLPFYAILCLPILFAAGMTLFDTLDGMFMNFAYGWAFSRPVRKIFYNLAITGLSVAVALLIGGIELLAVLGGRAVADRRAVGRRDRHRPQPDRLPGRGAVRAHVGDRASRSGGWAGSRSAGRRSCDDPRAAPPAARLPRHRRRRARAARGRRALLGRAPRACSRRCSTPTRRCRPTRSRPGWTARRSTARSSTSRSSGSCATCTSATAPGLYALTGGAEREYLACERCDRVTALDAEQLDEVRALIEREFGYRARFSHFPIVGLCADCAAATDA